MNNPFWEYSLDRYAVPEVADCCLILQDTCALDVNLLLYAAWLASRGRCLQLEHLQALDREIHDWRERVVRPLRNLRREWRQFTPAADLCEDLKALELQAERGQQDLMWAFYRAAPALPSGCVEAEENLRLVAAYGATGSADWQAPTTRLASLLAR